MSGAMIALIVVVIFIVLGGGGCATCLCIAASHKSKTTASADPPPKAVKAPAPAAPKDNWITSERPYVKFLVPPTWNTNISTNKEWGVFKSASKDSVIAFTTFTQPGESTVKLGKAASVLGVTDVNWGAARPGIVGKDKFDAHIGDGSCNFEGPGGYIWYATVNTGTSDQVLLIYTVAANAPKARRAEAQSVIDSLQRR
jgi:hypothetical protein